MNQPSLANLLPNLQTAGIELLPRTGAPVAAAAPLLASNAGTRPQLAVVATTQEANSLVNALQAYLPATAVASFPAWETLPHERLSPRPDTVGERLTALLRLHGKAGEAGPGLPSVQVVVAPIRALLQPVAADLLDFPTIAVQPGQALALELLVSQLVGAGYVRVEMVQARGQFAVRGGIVDVFSAVDAQATRIEFWGDEVDSIRSFTVTDQRSTEPRQSFWAPAARELLLTPAVQRRAAELVSEFPIVADLLTKIANGVAVEGMESLQALLVPQLVPVLQLMPSDLTVVALTPERLQRRAADVMQTAQEFLDASWSNTAAGNAAPVDINRSEGAFYGWDDLVAASSNAGQSWYEISPFGSAEAEFQDLAASLTSPAQALSYVENQISGGGCTIITASNAGTAARLQSQLAAVDIAAPVLDQAPADLSPGVVIVTGAISGAWSVPKLQLSVLHESHLTGRAAPLPGAKSMPATPRKRHRVDPLSLTPGDFVVHETHGIGSFVELVSRTVRGVEREYLVIEYAASRRGAPPDRLSVPTDQLDLVSKYVGGAAPTLSKMGGSDWAATKGRARKAVKEIAAELIRLYSARMASKGRQFGPDTQWQRELAESFPFTETADQMAAITDVTHDMEQPIPMDRLICGDVGFGKTEVAIRAAFKAVQDGCQVAVLCPTTLLVKQHLDTFTARFAAFPVRVASLSRFQTAKESKEVLAGLADGSIDVVIGTHRLLTGSVQFKQLGLAIIDEEQRFGVEHKETLKAMRTNVDVLAMSATPIPRTLEMAVTGIREMSVLNTPPEERLPILTYVGPRENGQISAAIRRELMRDGQVFYIHNSVKTILRTASQISELVPEARVAVAHGKMSEKELEQVIVDYYEQRYDVLVCTTIVETGLDIPNANTLIVEHADAFGLSQLHQLRGRVGRGRERAYAYFLYSPDKPMTEIAHSRLETLAANTDLGSGMAVALKDLEMRGAGNLLGAEQSGHIEGVGFDLYIRMVGEAVANFRGEGTPEKVPVTIELPIDAHIPESYVGHENLRLEAYRRIAATEDEVQLTEVWAELTDRYGPPPQPVQDLFEVARLRQLLRAVGITDVIMQGNYVRLSPVKLPDSAVARLKRIHPGTIFKLATRQILVPAPKTARLGGTVLSGGDLLAWVKEVIPLTQPITLG